MVNISNIACEYRFHFDCLLELIQAGNIIPVVDRREPDQIASPGRMDQIPEFCQTVGIELPAFRIYSGDA